MQKLIDGRDSGQSRTSFGATVFRDDASAAYVIVSDFGFDGCRLSSDATFRQGEVLRLHRSGQGCILMTVSEVAPGTARTVFLTTCKV